MFHNECNQKHENSFTESCCLNHLIEMHFVAENQNISHKYAKFLTRTMNHHFKRDTLQFDGIKLETAKIFLEILSKYITYFFCLNQLDLGKLLIKISLIIGENGRLKDNQEILKRKSSIFNNLSCIYERMGNYTKALQYLKRSYKYISLFNKNGVLNADLAIFYNNIGRISYKQKENNIANQAMKMSYDIVREESLKILKEKSSYLANKNNLTGNNLNTNLCRLFGFLYFNYGCHLLSCNTNDNFAKDIFKQGYEFSVNLHNEYDDILSKFRDKLQFSNYRSMKSITSNSFKYQNTFESKYDSDIELPNIFNRTKTIKGNISQEILDKHPDCIGELNKNNTIGQGELKSNGYLTNYEDMKEIKNKVDMLLMKFEDFQSKKISPNIVNNTSNSNVFPRSEKRFQTRKEEFRPSSSKYEDLKQMIKPRISRLISEVYPEKGNESNSPNSFKRSSLKDLSVIKKKQTNFTEEYLQELVNEFENSKEFNNSKDSIKLNDLNRTKNSKSSSKLNLTSDKNLIQRKKESNENVSSASQKESSLNPISKTKKKLKDLFCKVIPEDTLKKINETHLNPLPEDGKIFTKLVSSLIEEDSQLQQKIETPKKNSNRTSKSSQVLKAPPGLIENWEIEFKSNKNVKTNSNDNNNNNSNSSLDLSNSIILRNNSPDNSKKNSNSFESINKNNLNSNYTDSNKLSNSVILPNNQDISFKNNLSSVSYSYSDKNTSNINENKNSNQNNYKQVHHPFKISVIPDDENIDLYEAKTFYFKRSTSKDKIEDPQNSNSQNNNNPKVEYKINLHLDQDDYVYQPKTFYILKNNRHANNPENKEKENNVKNVLDKYKINVELDNEDYSYKPKTFYIARRSNRESDLNNTPETKEQKLIEESFHTNLTPSFNQTISYENQNSENFMKTNKNNSHDYDQDQEYILNSDDNSKFLKIQKEKFMTLTNYNENENLIAEDENGSSNRMISLDPDESKNLDLNEAEVWIDSKDQSNSLRSFFNSKKISEKDFTKFFDQLIENYIKNSMANNPDMKQNTIYTIIRELDNVYYKIGITIEKNERGDMGIQFRLYKENSPEIINQSFIKFEKLKKSQIKLSIYNSLSTIEDIFDFNNFEDYLKKILIYHCHLQKTSKNPSISLLTRPIGICANSLYEFQFLNTLCFMDVLIPNLGEIKLIIYNKKK